MAEDEISVDANEPIWRQRVVSRSLSAARSRAERRAERFLEAAFKLIDEKGTTEFTIQEVVDHSQQSLRGFYQYFDGKDELLFALFEETVNESIEDIRSAIRPESDPMDRLRVFTVRLHEWCEPIDTSRKRGKHRRLAISEFSLQLALKDPQRVGAVMAPISRILLELIEEATAAGRIKPADTRRATLLVQQTVMYSWLVNRIVANPRLHVSAEETWDFCIHGLRG